MSVARRLHREESPALTASNTALCIMKFKASQQESIHGR
jgi:hypothetical protein